MEGLGRYTAIFFNVCRKDYKYWLSFFLLCLGMLFLLRMKLPDAEGSAIGVVYPDSPAAIAVFDRPEKTDNGFLFKRYQSRNMLEQDLLKGRLDCAFLFPEDFDDRLEQGELRDSIICLRTPFTAKAALAEEYLYAGILRQYSPVLLKTEMNARLENKEDQAAMDEMLEKETAAYLDSDVLFSVEVKNVTGQLQETDPAQNKTEPVVRGMAAVLLFLFSAYEILERRNGAYVGFLELLGKKNRRRFRIASYVAESAVPCLLVTGLLAVWEKSLTLPAQILKGIICWAVIGIYILILWSIRLKKEYITVTVFGLSLLWIVVNPVVTDLSVFIPAVRYLRTLTPVYWML